MKKGTLATLMLTILSLLLSACGADSTATVVPAAATTAKPAATATTATTAPTATTAMVGQTPAAGRKVVVSSKNFTEEFLVGEIYALALENAGVPVDRKMNLGASDIAQAALLKGGASGGIDLYPEYTSTGLTVILKQAPIYDPPAVFAAVKKGYEDQFKLTWLDASPLNDTQAFVITKPNSQKLGITSLTDLCSKASTVTLGAIAEFKDRPDAYPRLQSVYGACNFKDIKSLDPSLFYTALLNGDIDVTQAFSTDGPIAGNDLLLLADPKNYGLPYNVAPVVRDDVLAIYPQISTTLNVLAPKLTNDVVSALNWEVDGKKRDYQDVAKEWMQQQGLLK
ncbi:MAG: glycine betaine ABC transporter substrate-binding protein [Chloroflexota bacterium]